MATHAHSTTAPAVEAGLLPLDRRAIGRDGWARAREAAACLGGEIRDHVAEGMRQAWAAARGLLQSGQPEESRLPDYPGISEVADSPNAAGAVPPLLLLPAPLPSLTAALPRRWAIFGAVAVDSCADISTACPAGGVDITIPVAPHGGAPICATVAQTPEPRCELMPTTEPDTAAEARAIHARRELHGALEWGFAFLDAFDLGPLALDVVDGAIARMDAMDGDTDREPYLSGYYNGAIDPNGEREGEEDPDEDDGISEPSLASPERHPTVPWSGNWRDHYVTRDRQDTQAHWADGSVRDLEGEITDEPHDGDGEDLEAEPSEPSLGSIEAVSQLGWSAGGTSEVEFDATDGVRLYKGPAEWEATFARRDSLHALAARARALRSRARPTCAPSPNPDTLIPLAPGVMWWAGPAL